MYYLWCFGTVGWATGTMQKTPTKSDGLDFGKPGLTMSNSGQLGG